MPPIDVRADDPPVVRFKDAKATRRAYNEHVKAAQHKTGHGPTIQDDELWRKHHGIPRERMRTLRDESEARTQEDRDRGRRKSAD